MAKFSRQERIRTTREYAAVRKSGVRCRAGVIQLTWMQAPVRRLGVVVSSHVGNAVQRNRIKRVVREFFRCNKDSFPRGDCVVVPTNTAGGATNAEIRDGLCRALTKIRK